MYTHTLELAPEPNFKGPSCLLNKERKWAFSVHRFLFQLVKTNPFESQLGGELWLPQSRTSLRGYLLTQLELGLGRLDKSAQPASSLNRPRRALALQPAVLGLLRGCWGLPTTSHPLEPPGAGQGQLQDGEGRPGGTVAQEAWDPTVMPLQLPAGPTPLTTASTVRTGSPAPRSTGAEPCAVLPVGIVSSSAAGMPQQLSATVPCSPVRAQRRERTGPGGRCWEARWPAGWGGHKRLPFGAGGGRRRAEKALDGPPVPLGGRHCLCLSSACGCSAPGPQLGNWPRWGSWGAPP